MYFDKKFNVDRISCPAVTHVKSIFGLPFPASKRLFLLGRNVENEKQFIPWFEMKFGDLPDLYCNIIAKNTLWLGDTEVKLHTLVSVV